MVKNQSQLDTGCADAPIWGFFSLDVLYSEGGYFFSVSRTHFHGAQHFWYISKKAFSPSLKCVYVCTEISDLMSLFHLSSVIMAIYLSFNKNTNIYSALWYLHTSATGWNPALYKNKGRASGGVSGTVQGPFSSQTQVSHTLQSPMKKPRCHLCSFIHTWAFYAGDKCNSKDILEHGRHPGVYVSPSLCLCSV